MYIIKKDWSGEIVDFAFYDYECDEKLKVQRTKVADPEDLNPEWRDAEADLLLTWMIERPEHIFHFKDQRKGATFEIRKKPFFNEWRFELRLGPVWVELIDLRASHDNRQLWAESVIIDVSDLDVVE